MEEGGKTVRVALINPPLSRRGYRHQPYLPIGLAYLAAVLEKNEHEVEVIDCPALRIDHEKLKTKIASIKPEMVGITSMTPTIHSVFTTSHIIKEACPEAPLILGGVHATFMEEQILSDVPEVDIVVRGEGEHTITELASMAANPDQLDKVAGIAFRKGEKIIRTTDRPFIEDLDALPYPALKHFLLEKYRVFGRKILPIITSRGCPFQCSFCVTSRVFGKKTRMRQPKKVVDELEWLRDEHGADAYTFFDDTFTLNRGRVHKICDEMIRRKVDVPWDCETRVDQISREVLAKMKKAGCQVVTLGIESGCQHILNAVNKRTSVEQNERGIRLVKEAGLSVVTSVIVGYPGETLETIKQTLDFIRRVKPDDAYVCVATPYPGTELYRLVIEKGWKMSPDWSQYDTVTPVFENPSIPGEKIVEVRKRFYDDFYSTFYILRQMSKVNFYNRILARIALNHFIWRIRSVL